MYVRLTQHDDDALLTVTGDVGTVDVPTLRGLMVDAFEQSQGDLLLDVRKVPSVSDHLMTALTATRSLARRLRRRIVVIDDVTGATTGSLRRLGLQFQIPVYQDPAAALAGVRTDRAVRAGRVAAGRLAPPPLPSGADGCWSADPDDEVFEPPVPTARTLWAVAARRPAGPGNGS